MKTKLQRDIEVMDAIVRDLFANGGPQRATAAEGRITIIYTNSATMVLEEEHRRLVRNWRKS